ncbi:MAG: hypothetical protein ACYCTV_09065 [Leptospirales bacterium]
MRKKRQAVLGIAVLAAGLLALEMPSISWAADSGVPVQVADNLSPDTPYSQPSDSPASPSSGGVKNGSKNPWGQVDTDHYNSEFHNSFQNLMPDSPPPGYTSMLGKWTTMMYGFVQFDTVYDSSNSFNNWPFNAGAANSATVSGGGSGGLGSTVDHNAFGADVNNSRIGFALSSPVYHGYKLRALLEMDFLANPGETQYGGTAAAGSAGSGTGYLTNPIFRIRHFFMDITTPEYGNFLLGQYWSLFGWQPYNIYNSVQIAPAPGTLYGRFPQARWYKVVHLDEGNKVEVAAAVQMPPAFISGVPTFVEGIKWANSDWMGEGMIGDTGKGQFPVALGFSDIQTNFQGYTASSVGTVNGGKTTYAYTGNGGGFNQWTSAYALDLWLPIIPIHGGKPGNNLTLTAEYSYGSGDAWQFPNLNFGTGGCGAAAANNSCLAGAAGTYPGGTFFMNGNAFVPLDVQTYNMNLQYYFPDDAHTSISLGIAVDNSTNLQSIANAVGALNTGGAGSANGLFKYTAAWTRNTFAFVDLWHDFTPAVRAGLEFGQYDTLYTTGLSALDNRVMMSWFYLF